MELLTGAQMRAIEAAAMESGAVSSLQLMEEAGRGVLRAIFDEWPDLASAPGRAVVVCGPGNNGGDGYVIARRLKDRRWDVEVWSWGDPERLPPDAAANLRLWREMGDARAVDPAAMAAGERPDLLIDALFGIGLTRSAPPDAIAGLKAVAARPSRDRRADRCRAVAVDCPSGLNCDTGFFIRPEGKADGDVGTSNAHRCAADLTVTFHRPKIGHYLAEGPDGCGVLAVCDIGVEDAAPPDREFARLVGERPLRDLIRMPRAGAHKYDRGHALVLAGGSGKGGAARLAARAALRVGAGLVTIACPPEALVENAARLDAIMLRPLVGPDDLSAQLADRRIGALCIGPGLGVGPETRALVLSALTTAPDGEARGRDDRSRRRVVLDADALTSFSDAPDELFAALHRNCVLTPHEGEFARLFPDLSEKRRRAAGVSKVDAARTAARRAGCVVLLKGPDTVIADPDGRAAVHAAVYGRAAPWLGTAGAGDVLAGLIAGLLARSGRADRPMADAAAAAWLHVEAARAFGPGLIADDLPEQIPSVFRRFGL